MTFEEAGGRYAQLRSEYEAGRMSASTFQEAVALLTVCDAESNWWQMDAQTGEWVRWDGAAWVRSSQAAPPAAYTPSFPSPSAPSGMASAPPGMSAWNVPAAQQQPQPAGAWYPPRQEAPSYQTPAPQMMLATPPRGRQIFFDVIAMLGSVGMAGAWYWYSGLSNETPPDRRTCLAMVLMPLLLIVLRGPLDRLLQPLQKVRAGIPRMVLLGTGVAIPFLVANYLYARGYSQFDYLFRTYVISTLLSYVILRTPSMPAQGGR